MSKYTPLDAVIAESSINADAPPLKRRPGFWGRFKEKLHDHVVPKPMPFVDAIRLDWLTKWRKYNRFPFKLVLHVTITILCTILAVSYSSFESAYNVAMKSSLSQLLLPIDYQIRYNFDAKNSMNYIYNVEDCVELINTSISSFYSLKENSIDVLSYGITQDTPPASPMLTVSYYAGGLDIFNFSDYNPDTSINNQVYYLNNTSLGPFSESLAEIRQFLRTMVSMSLELEIYSANIKYGHLAIYQWAMQLYFDFTQRGGRIALTLNIERVGSFTNTSVARLFSFGRISLDILLLITCLISMAVAVRSILHGYQIYKKTRDKLSLGGKNKWSDIPFRIKIRFIRGWIVISLFAALSLLIYSILDLAVGFGASEDLFDYSVRLFLGLGCLLSYVNMLRYLEFDRQCMVLIDSLGSGLPNVFRFVLGVVPVFIGYAMFGLVFFADDTQRFASFDESIVTLFGLQNGDDVQNTFRSSDMHPIVSRLYFFSFLMISIYGVANIFIAIIEDSYWAVKGAESPNKSAQAGSKDKAGDEANFNPDDKDNNKKDKKKIELNRSNTNLEASIDMIKRTNSKNSLPPTPQKSAKESEPLIQFESEEGGKGEHEGGALEREKELARLWQRLLDLHVEELKDNTATEIAKSPPGSRVSILRQGKDDEDDNNNNKEDITSMTSFSSLHHTADVEMNIDSIVEELFEKQKAKLGRQLKKKLSDAMYSRKR